MSRESLETLSPLLHAKIEDLRQQASTDRLRGKRSLINAIRKDDRHVRSIAVGTIAAAERREEFALCLVEHVDELLRMDDPERRMAAIRTYERSIVGVFESRSKNQPSLFSAGRTVEAISLDVVITKAIEERREVLKKEEKLAYGLKAAFAAFRSTFPCMFVQGEKAHLYYATSFGERVFRLRISCSISRPIRSTGFIFVEQKSSILRFRVSRFAIDRSGVYVANLVEMCVMHSPDGDFQRVSERFESEEAFRTFVACWTEVLPWDSKRIDVQNEDLIDRIHRMPLPPRPAEVPRIESEIKSA